MRLLDKHFLVTGAGSGIGRAVAIALAAEGARVSLLGRDLTKLSITAALLGAGVGDSFSVNLAYREAIMRFAQQFWSSGMHLHGLVHAAGEYHRGAIREALPTAAGALLSVNSCGPLLLTSALLPRLRQQQGDVVFVNSLETFHGCAGVAEYAMANAANRALAESLRAEENAQGVRVTSIYVGQTATPMQERVAREEGHAYHPERLLQPVDVAAAIIAAVTLPHTAEVTDIHIRPTSLAEQ